jgi:hypothetical protein
MRGTEQMHFRRTLISKTTEANIDGVDKIINIGQVDVCDYK